MNHDVIIIGAGIVGAACALECARAGLRALVLEERIIGGGATAAGMGHIVAMDDSEAQFALTRYSQLLWDELATQLPPACEYLRCGTLWIAADGEEMDEVRRKQAFYAARGVASEILDAQSLAEAEPNLRAGLAGALRVPADSVVFSMAVARYLIEQAQTHGAQLLTGQAVAVIDDGAVTLTDGRQCAADVIINATGTWAVRLAPDIPVKPRKGHLVITDRYPGFARHQLVELGYLKSAHAIDTDSVAFNVQPRATGQVLIGSSRQYGDDDATINQTMLRWMLERAREYMPGLAHLSALRVWTGLRAATPDKLPLIGRAPSYDKVYLATGHEGLGITTSLGTARLLVDQLLQRRSAISFAPYLPTRDFTAHA